VLELAEHALVGHIHAGVPPKVLERLDQVLSVLVHAGQRLEGRVDVLVLVSVHVYRRDPAARAEQQLSCVRADALVADEGRVELEREGRLGDDGVCRHRMYGPADMNLVSLAAGSPGLSRRSISARSATHRHAIARPGGSADAELGGESSAQPQEFLPLGSG
jgi:hypothetical protein